MEKINFADGDVVKKIKSKWSYGAIDVCISTYNRLPYVTKCINSILATKMTPGKIIVHDDGSTDGTKEWLQFMLKRGKIHNVVESNRIGTAESLNKCIKNSTSEIVIISNDDMYFYRYWDVAMMNVFNTAERCGIVTFYNYSRLNTDGSMKEITGDYSSVIRTGMGCTAIIKELFMYVQGFNLPNGMKMGYFASHFCGKVNTVGNKYPNNLHYVTRPHYALHIDHPAHIMNERDVLEDYGKFRKNNKRGFIPYDYYSKFNPQVLKIIPSSKIVKNKNKSKSNLTKNQLNK